MQISEDSRSIRAGLAGCCELPAVGAGTELGSLRRAIHALDC